MPSLTLQTAEGTENVVNAFILMVASSSVCEGLRRAFYALKFPERCLFICNGALFRRNTQVEPGPRYVFSGRGLYPICHSGLGTACHPVSFMEQETTDLTLLSYKIKKNTVNV